MRKTAIIIISTIGLIAGLGYLFQPVSVEERAKTQANLVQDSVSPISAETLNLEVADFEVNTVAGDKVKLSELVADKPTMVGFWASWCHNCQRNLPIQNELYQKYKDQVNIVEVNMSERASKVDGYIKDKGYDFHVGYDEQGVVARAFGVSYTNTHYLIGADGSLLQAFPGDITEAHFEQLVASVSSE